MCSRAGPRRDTAPIGSRESIELVRRHHDAYLRGDFDGALAVMAEDIVWDNTRGADGAVYHGHAGVTESNRQYFGAFAEFEFEPLEYMAGGDRVLVRFRQRGRGRVSGAVAEGIAYHVWTTREGRLVRYEYHPDRDEALRAAGLAPGLHPVVMGVVNVTPDSFSDGGEFLDPQAAIAHGRELSDGGAAILDVGGESTRPGAEPVPRDEELRRVAPVLDGLAGSGARLSIDTTKSAVARAAIERGADVVNDVSAFRVDPEMVGLVADAGVDCCLMHMLGEPRTMQVDPRYGDVVSEVKAFLEERLAFAVGEGVAEERIWLDPGIGFGKRLEHNLELLRRLGEIAAIGRPVVVGTSRKSFLGRLTGRGERERLAGTIATNVLALERGAQVFRVHDVAPVADALAVAAATVREP